MSVLSALTLNMQNGQVWDEEDPDGAPISVDSTISFLREQDPDVIFLQEVEYPNEPFPDLRKRLNYERIRQGLAEYHTCFTYPQASRGHLPFGIGIAILSKARQRDTFHVILPASDVSFEFKGESWLPAERSILGTHIDLDGERILLLNTHLQAYFMINSSSDEQPTQRKILETILRGRKHPVLLGGDFNCSDNEGTIAGLEACGVKTLQKEKITWHRMPFVLDHIFYSPEFETLHNQVIETDISDHHAVYGTFRLHSPIKKV